MSPPPPTWCHIARRGARFACRFAATALVAGTAACSGGGDTAAGGAPGAPSSTAGAPRPTTVPPTDGASTSTTAATTTTPPPPPATTPVPPAGAPTTVATGPSGVAGGPAALAGRYTYDTTGAFTSPLGTGPRNGETVLTVDPPAGGQQRGVRVGPGRTVEQVLRNDGDGAYLVSLTITDSGFAQHVRPAAPVLAVPSPAPVGRQWSWQSPTVDGRTTVSSSFRVARTESLAVGGEAVPTSVIEATIATTGDVVSTGRQTFWYSERHRLVVQLQEVTDGRVAGAIAFRSETTERLRSLVPA